MNKEFDVLNDIIVHKAEVQNNIEEIKSELTKRGIIHDKTKFQELEFDAFCSTREKFKKADYGSKEYQECIDAIQPAIDHHYKNNRHHTAFHKNGIEDMSLIDILEMLADWKSAVDRRPNKKLVDTLEISFEKYKISEEIQKLIKNTLQDLQWI